uniref:Uncharacterized protein n=1 Tax=Fusarium oxysporum (strain Fo5176) TaxID=660025 RepID=A0A0D2XKL3_FUSOF
MLDLFSVPVFVVVFRETLETAIIVSVLLAFLKQTLDGSQRDAGIYKTLRTQYYYEGVFSLISAIIITIMGGALLRVGKMEDKWRAKLAKAIETPVTAQGKRAWLVNLFEKYAMFVLPFITVLREAGLFSRAIWLFEQQQWNKVVGGDAAELGDGPGSYDIDRSIWHCCNPQLNGGGGWAILNAVVGWNNSATYGSVLAYNLYWVFVIAQFSLMSFKEDHGHYPLLKEEDARTD